MRVRHVLEDKRVLTIFQLMSFLVALILSLGSMIILVTIIILQCSIFLLWKIEFNPKWISISWEMQWFSIIFGYTLLDFNSFYNVTESTLSLRVLFLIFIIGVQLLLLYYLIFMEKAIKRILLALSSSSAIAVILIILFIFNEGLPAFIENDPVDFITGETWQPFYEEPNTYILELDASISDHSFTLTLNDDFIIALPGKMLVFNMTIFNDGVLTDTFLISTSDQDCIVSSDTIDISGQDSKQIEFTILDIGQGIKNITIYVNSLTTNITKSATQSILIDESSFNLAPSRATIISSGDDSLKSGFDFEITNEDTVSHNYTISINASDYFRPFVTNCSWNNNEKFGSSYLEAGTSAVFTVTPRLVVLVPGDYQIYLNVRSLDSINIQDSCIITFSYEETDVLTIVDSTNVTSYDGKPSSFTISIAPTSDQGCYLWLEELDDGWSYQILHNSTLLSVNDDRIKVDLNDTNTIYTITATPLNQDIDFTNFNIVLMENYREPTFGIMPFIIGTIITTIIAISIAAPFGIGCAIFMVEYCPLLLKKKLRMIFDLLAGIPSVIYGLWGALTLAPLLVQHLYPLIVDIFGGWIWFLADGVDNGRNIFTASIVLAIMILPIIISLSADSIAAVDPNLRKSSIGLGASRSQTLRRIVIPKASSGIISSIILATGRAIGETMAVVMVMGAASMMPNSVFDASGTMTSVIATTLGWGYNYESLRHALFATALVLFIMVFMLNLIIFKVKGEIKLGKNPRIRLFSFSFLNIFHKITKGIKIPKRKGRTEYVESNKLRFKDRSFQVGVYACALSISAVLLFILCDILIRGGSSLEIQFLLEPESEAGISGGFLNSIAGSVYLVALAIFFSIFLAIGSAIYMVEYSSTNSISTKLILFTTNTLASTPSIIFGAFGFLFFVLFLDMGYSLLAGSLTLALMVLPILLVSTTEALKSVPQDLRLTSYALGVSKWGTVRNVVLPAAFPGIVSGIILSIGRAIGETAAILFTAFYTSLVVDSLLMPAASLPNMIYKFYDLGVLYPSLEQKIYSAALVLIFIVLIINFVARAISNRAERYHNNK